MARCTHPLPADCVSSIEGDLHYKRSDRMQIMGVRYDKPLKPYLTPESEETK